MNGYDKYLPIGTVLMLKNGTKRLMITGYVQIDGERKDKVYDYCGCLYPEGVVSSEKNMLFNHEDIEKLYCIGFKDEEQKEFLENLKSTMTEETLKKLLDVVQGS